MERLQKAIREAQFSVKNGASFSIALEVEGTMAGITMYAPEPVAQGKTMDIAKAEKEWNRVFASCAKIVDSSGR